MLSQVYRRSADLGLGPGGLREHVRFEDIYPADPAEEPGLAEWSQGARRVTHTLGLVSKRILIVV